MKSFEHRLKKLELAGGTTTWHALSARSYEDLAFFLAHGFWPEEITHSKATNLDPNYLTKAKPYTHPQLLALCVNMVEQHRNEIWARCAKRVASFNEGPMLWLTQHTRTEDHHWMTKGTPPIAPFPKEEYMVHCMGYMLKSMRLLIPKSREMMTSWLSCGMIAWMCQWYPNISWLIQTEKLDKATQLIDYCRILYRQQDAWMRERVPLVVDNRAFLELANGSWIRAIPKGANQVRLYHPYGYLMDEAAHLSEAEACFNIASPVAKQIIAVSSVAPGWFDDMCKLA